MELFKKKQKNPLDYKKFWENLYESGGNSGNGSYGIHAEYKSEYINRFISNKDIETVLEFGCGDGNQLSFYKFKSYHGLDVSGTAVEICKKKFKSNDNYFFEVITPSTYKVTSRYDLVICLEVLMHIIDYRDYELTLDHIFNSSARYVILLTPLAEILEFPVGHHEKYRNLIYSIIPKLGEFRIINAKIHPSVTIEDRLNKKIGDMSSDFIVFERVI